VRDVLAAVAATGAEPERWEVREPTLDDVFLTLTGHATRTRAPRDTGSTAPAAGAPADHEETAA